MNTTLRALSLSLSATALVAGATGCETGAPTDQLTVANEISFYPGALATPGNTQQHHQEVNLGQHGVTDPTVVEKETLTVGSIEVEARLHSCSKVTYAALGQMLTSRGIDMTSTSNGSPGMLWQTGVSALGVADYPARVPEMLLPTTATEAKQMDIYVAAAQMLQPNATTAMASTTGCSGVSLMDSTGAFTQDGLSCLMGKPATASHLAIANQILTEAPDPTTGANLAIATILEAAHTCE
jgi:hypothetical protein